MRIAVFLDDIQLNRINKNVTHVFLFDVDHQLIKAVGKELMKINDINYICLWLLGKQVRTVYYDHFAQPEKTLLEKVGINIRPFDEIRDNPILYAMLVYP